MRPVTSAVGRLQSLDGLRGLAALVVVVHHSLLVVPALSAQYLGGGPSVGGLSWLVYSPAHLVWAGGEAVWVFFVLSGFVLTRGVLARPSFDWRAYYPSRLVRLYLPVLGAVVLGLGVALAVPRNVLPTDSGWLRLHANPISFREILLDVTLLARPGSALNSALWSLRWEVVFSLLLPVFVWLAVRVDARLLLVAAAVSATIGEAVSGPAPGRLVGTVGGALLFLPVFLVGCVLASRFDAVRAVLSRMGSRRWSRAAWAVLLLGSVVALTFTWTLGSPLSASGSFWLAPVTLAGAGSLVVLAIAIPAFRGLLETSALQWLGRISFSLYLVHEPIVVSVGLLLPAELRWWTVALATPIALAVAALFFRLIEGPSHRLAQSLGRLVATRRLIQRSAG